MVLLLNDKKESWNLLDENKKIDLKVISSSLKSHEENTNDFHSAYWKDSELIENETVLKEQWVKQIAFVAYNVDIERYNELKLKKECYDTYCRLHKEGQISRAQLAVLKAGYKDFKDLEIFYQKNIDIFNDINFKYDIYVKTLELKGLLDLKSSFKARTNESNKLNDETYTVSSNTQCHHLIEVLSAKTEDYEKAKVVYTNTDNLLKTAKDKLESIKQSITITKRDLDATEITKADNTKLLNIEDEKLKKVSSDLEENQTKLDFDNKKVKDLSDYVEEFKGYKTTAESLNYYFDVYIDKLEHGEFSNEYDIDIVNTLNELRAHISIEATVNTLNEIQAKLEEYISLKEEFTHSEAIAYINDNIKPKINDVILFINSEIINASNSIEEYNSEIIILQKIVEELQDKYSAIFALKSAYENLVNQNTIDIEKLSNDLVLYKQQKVDTEKQIDDLTIKVDLARIDMEEKERIMNMVQRALNVANELNQIMHEKQDFATEHKDEITFQLALANEIVANNRKFFERIENLSTGNWVSGDVKKLIKEFQEGREVSSVSRKQNEIRVVINE